jgi:hypothetical protein
MARQLAGGHAEAMPGGDVAGEFAVAAANVLHQCRPGSQDPRGPVAFSPRIGRSRAFSRTWLVSTQLLA